jgi:hypothetical protein
MNILISPNEGEPSWITKLLFVIRNNHLYGNHSNTKKGTGIKVPSSYHGTHLLKVIYINHNNIENTYLCCYMLLEVI